MEGFFTTLIIIAAVLLLVGFAVLYNTTKGGTDQLWKKQLKSDIIRISAEVKSTNPRILRQLVIDTDKHLDYALKNSRVKGETMGERLKSAKTKFDKSTYNLIWEAHKLRNRLVHEMSFEPNASELKKSYYDLRKGIDALIN